MINPVKSFLTHGPLNNARMSPITRSLLGKQVVLHYHPYLKLQYERITQFMMYVVRCLLTLFLNKACPTHELF